VSTAHADPRGVRHPLAIFACAGALLAAGCGSSPAEREVASAGQDAPAAAEPADQTAAMAPLPKARPTLVTPAAGKSSHTAADDLPANAGTVSADDTSLPKPTGPASGTEPRPGGDANATNLSADTATALSNGVALPPLDAPEAVLNVIRAGNIIARTPYKWGGGHGRFQDNGYDCSGSVSYALYYAGLIDGPHVSGELMAYGEPGPGKWITIYANGGHVYMEVAGIRFDTSGATETGSRWQNELTGNRGGAYEVRHPPGL
jgi:cell wall-associated NlpC family hydrolase